MLKKIKDRLLPSDEQKFLRYNQSFRKKHIPERYNQIKLVDYLLDEDIDHYISISNRSDGKSFNYCHFLLRMSIENELGFTFLVRHFTVREAGQKLFQKIIDTVQGFNPLDFVFMRTEFYIALIYKDRYIGIITDLNKATDLKYQSNFLADFPIIIYDEFLALEGDYLIDEWDRLKTIYGSINRGHDIPLIKTPKIFYLGNAVNFSSPILANLNLFNLLEKHKMNTIRKYGNICLELNRNDNANESRNLRAFRENEDNLASGEFKVNKHIIATEIDWNRINKSHDFLYVKLRNSYLKITYNLENYESILSIVSYAKDYEYNLLIKDNIETSTFLNDTFFDDDYIRFYEKGIHLFDNMYSKDYVLDGSFDLRNIRINKIIKHHLTHNELNNFERNEKIYKENYIKNTRKSLVKKFLI